MVTILVIHLPHGGISLMHNFRGHVRMLRKVLLIPNVIVYMNTPTNTQEERMRKFSHDLGKL